MKKATLYFKLFRWPNLVIMAAILSILRYGFLIPLTFNFTLSHLWFGVLVIATLFIAAGGNAVNDAFDINADRINKPQKMIIGKGLSKDDALFAGQFLLMLGSFIGLALGYFNDLLTFSYVFPLSAILLWFYATTLKRLTLWGNLVVSLLGALLVFNVAIFDVLPTLKYADWDMQIQAVYVISGIAGFSFVLTLIREIIKDLQDVQGDRQAGYKTLPITSGTSFPKILAIGLLMLTGVALIWLGWQSIVGSDWISGIYLFALILIPILVAIIRVAPAQTSDQFQKISALLKWIMVIGLFSVLVFTISFKIQWGM